MSGVWTLCYRGVDSSQEALREALCTLGNGVFATRGAGEERRADGVHYPGSYLAGGYNRLVSRIVGRDVENEDLVNFPNWTPLSFRVDDGPWFGEAEVEYSDYEQTLHLKEGRLTRSFIVSDTQGRQTRIQTARIVCMHDPHLAGIQFCLESLNWDGRMELRATLDGSVTNDGVARYRDLEGDHLVVVDAGGADNSSWLVVKTNQASLAVSLSARHTVWIDDRLISTVGEVRRDDARAVWSSPRFDVLRGETVRLEKVLSLHTSREPASGDLLGDGLEDLEKAPAFDELLDLHRRRWDGLWERFDVRIEVDPAQDLAPYPIQLILRLHAFHLLQTASPLSRPLDVSVPARGWTGESYRGHIFWDEAYILPFFISRSPEIARSLLLYRYRRLKAARVAAAEQGLSGAMFPWQSGSQGREETQVVHLNPRSGNWDPDHSHLQRHVNAAIARNVWLYVEQTGDQQFMESYGAEMLVEIAKFWSSLSTWNDERQRFGIAGVMGPDEFHEAHPGAEEGGLRNNTYTNVMAIWCLRKARAALDTLPQSLCESLLDRLEVNQDERNRWERITSSMALPVRHDGMLEQFEGYDALDELDWGAYQERYGDIARLDRILKAEGDSPDHYKLSKQADLCMLFYFLPRTELDDILARLGYEMSDARAAETIAYYRHRTSHGSTMSHLVHGAILLDHEPETAWAHYVQALRSDVEDTQGGTTPEGIHTAVMAGTVQYVVEWMAGARMEQGRPRVIPNLPHTVQSVRFVYLVQGVPLRVDVDHSCIRITSPPGAQAAIPVVLVDEAVEVSPGETVSVRLEGRRSAQSMPWLKPS